MYLIGFFASPLPYLLLVGIYMSGFAYINWKGAPDAVDDRDPQPSRVCLVAGHDHGLQPEGTALYTSDQPVSGPTVVAQDGIQPCSLPGHATLCLKPLLFPPYCLSAGSLFLLTGQAIRPPPIS